MKQFITYISMALLLLTSCADMDEFLSNGTGGTELKIGDVTTQDGIVQSRAVNTAGVLTSGSIGLFLRESGSTATTYDGTTYNDIQYTYSSGTWSAASTAIKLSGTSGSLYAYYPYNSSYTSLTAIPLTSSVNGEDLCYSGAVGVSDVKPAANIGLNHAMALIDLQFAGTWAISKLTITGTNVASTGTLDMTTGTVTATGTTGLLSLGSCQATSTSPVRCLIVPASSTATDVTISCLIGGATYTTTLSSVTLKSGAHYTVNMSVTLDHEYVDLGLPSGTKWATCNVGASQPYEYGGYFQWGGTTSHTFDYGFSWSNCPYQTASSPQYMTAARFSKYNIFSGYGTVDYITTLEPKDDAATANWGNAWRMPTYTEMEELVDNCNWESTSINNVAGYKVTSKMTGYTDKYIFLPKAGMNEGSTTYTDKACYWTNTLNTGGSYPATAGYLWDNSGVNYESRCTGMSVRPVVSSNVAGHDFVEINGVKWATMNVGATTVAESEATCFGDYYSFGSTDLYYSYISWNNYVGTVTYKSGYSQSSYCTQTIDTSILENNTIKPEYDVAHVKWGGNWRMPTLDDFKSLDTACGITSNYTSNTSATQLTSSTTTITAKGVYWLPGNMTIDGVKYTIRGILFVADDSDTSKRVFFPAGGGFVDSSSSTYDSSNYYGQYWTSTYSGSSYNCYSLYINGKVNHWLITSRASHGYNIRPVWGE